MDIWIRDGKIVKIQKHSNSLAEEGVKCCEVLEGRGKLFMPGLIDSHMHTAFVNVKISCAISAEPKNVPVITNTPMIIIFHPCFANVLIWSLMDIPA